MFLTSSVALVSFGERPRLMRISTLFGGEFKGAVRATELSVTTNMAASKILQDSMAVSSLSVKIEKKNSLRIRLTVFCSVYKSNQLIVRI